MPPPRSDCCFGRSPPVRDGYSLNTDCRIDNLDQTTFWVAQRVEITLSLPKGWTGKLHLRVLDYNKKGRSAVISLNGNKLGSIKEHRQGAWLAIPLSAGDTANGSVKVELLTPEKQDIVVTDLVAIPAGVDDPG